MKKPAKILVFGGSFDPPHRGHLRLLRAAAKRTSCDLIYVVPARRSPLKSPARAGAAERLALLRLALAHGLPAALRERVRVETSELSRARPAYTYQTLRRLKSRHPGSRLTFLLGSDALASFPRWRRPSELRRACAWLAAARPGARALRGRGLPGYSLLRERMDDVSSTDVRARLLADEEVSSLLAPRALARIRARGLYGLALHRRLRAELSPRRYLHSVCVARRARELALRHGLDAERAALAGLLHDCGRAVPVAAMGRFALARGLHAPLAREMAAREPLLLHAHIGEHLARRRHGVDDPEVLSAIRFHTLGGERMSALDRLLYVADACSADRAFKAARAISALARRDMDEAFALALRTKLEHALARGSWIHPLGLSLWNRLAQGSL